MPPESSAHNSIHNYWAGNAAFDPQRVLLKRLFFLHANESKYVSVSFYAAREYLPLVEFGVIRRCGSKAIIVTDEQVYTLAHDCQGYVQEGEGGDTSHQVRKW